MVSLKEAPLCIESTLELNVSAHESIELLSGWLVYETGADCEKGSV